MWRCDNFLTAKFPIDAFLTERLWLPAAGVEEREHCCSCWLSCQFCYNRGLSLMPLVASKISKSLVTHIIDEVTCLTRGKFRTHFWGIESEKKSAACRIRTNNSLQARPTLYQLSYSSGPKSSKSWIIWQQVPVITYKVKLSNIYS